MANINLHTKTDDVTSTLNLSLYLRENSKLIYFRNKYCICALINLENRDINNCYYYIYYYLLYRQLRRMGFGR